MICVCLIGSGILSTLIDFKINKTDFTENKFWFIIKILMYMFIIYLFTNTILWLFFENIYLAYMNTSFTIDFMFRYMWTSFIIALIVPIIYNIVIEKSIITIKIETKRSR